MTGMWSMESPRGVGAGHVDDRGHGVGAAKRASPEERRRAVRAVADLCRDAADCARLLDQLGLDPSEGSS